MPQIISTTFPCGGEDNTVTTERNEAGGESVSDFLDRHEEDLADAKANC